MRKRTLIDLLIWQTWVSLSKIKQTSFSFFNAALSLSCGHQRWSTLQHPLPPVAVTWGSNISYTHSHTYTHKKSRCRGAAGKISACVCVGWFRCCIRTMIWVVNHSAQVKSKSLSHPLTAHQGLSVYSASQQREKTSLSRRPLLFPSDYHWRTHAAVLTPLC